MRFSVVIPTYNEMYSLPKLLRDLRVQTEQDFEVVVADNHSSDGTEQLAREWGARVVEGGLPGSGRNKGAQAVRGEVIIFLDADVRLVKNFLEVNLREFEKRKLDLAMPRLGVDSQNWMDRLIFGVQDAWLRVTKNWRPFTVGFVTFVRKDVFESVGGYDEKIVLGEDVDLAMRLKKKKPDLKFGILPVKILASARRFEKEGRVLLSARMLWSTLMLHWGKDPNEKMAYEWGGYNENEKTDCE